MQTRLNCGGGEGHGISKCSDIVEIGKTLR